jgi:hydrogenase maturation protease
VIGVGNPWRRDDGAGVAVARRLGELAPPGVEARTHEGDGAGLLDAWAGERHVVIVDAARSGAAPGTLVRFDAGAEPLPARGLRSSTHGFGVVEATELARSLGRLPERLEVYAIEAADLGAGPGLSPSVASAVEALARQLAVAPR